MELNLCCFPNDGFHASGFPGLDTGAIKLDVMTTPPRLTYPDGKVTCTDGAFRSFSRLKVQFAQYIPCHIRIGCCILPGVFKPRASLTGRNKLETFLGEMAYNFDIM
jgi:hypothetical protein